MVPKSVVNQLKICFFLIVLYVVTYTDSTQGITGKEEQIAALHILKSGGDIISSTLRRMEEIEHIKQDNVNTAPYEIGYLLFTINEKYRKMVDKFNTSLTLQGKLFTMELIMYLEEIEVHYWEVEHLTNMLHEIERKYKINSSLDSVYREMTSAEIKEMKAKNLQLGIVNPRDRVPKKKKKFVISQYILDKLNPTKKKKKKRNWPLEYGWEINDYKWEQYIFNVFEVIVSTLETKLQRIENLDKAVEHLMRRVEALDSRVNDNIHKTDAIISKLGNLDLKLFSHIGQNDDDSVTESSKKQVENKNKISDAQLLDRKLESLDQKVSNIDTKLVGLKNQIDSNFLPVDDINAEASEKKPINLNVIEIAKGLNTEVINEITKEVDQLRSSVSTVDRKLQFHINLVSENLGKVLYMMADVHAAIVEPEDASINVNSLFKNRTATSTQAPVTKSSKIDNLVNKIIPMMSVSEKMDEVWDVVVGTKSSVDDLVPKSDELLTQTQRQERAIGQIHSDLRLKTNLIIENLDMVEKRLKKQEDDVATLAQRPVPAELLLDPTIDRLVEYAPNRYRVDEPYTDPTTSTVAATTMPPSSTLNNSPSTSTSSTSSTWGSTAGAGATVTVTPASTGSTSARPASRKGGIIFPSVKNKPIIGNNTFASEIVANYKDVKGYSCVDLMNGGMRESGVYYLQIRGTTYWFLKVYCEQNVADGGWTVIHRRDDYGIPAENFNRDWNDYKNGFGDPSKEFWLGNENIYMLTNNDDYMLRVELEDFDGNKRYAQYSHFKIYSEAEYYKLEIDGYEGNAGDSLNDPWYGSNNSPFSTYNRDNDRSSLNCASMLKGGWWWKSCGRGLNGLYLHDPQDLTARQGIVWFRWRGWDYTLKRASMMIKPKGLLPNT